MGLFKTSYNRNYMVVVEPLKSLGFKNRRWLVSPNNLDYYIGAHNANTVLVKGSAMRADKLRLRFRTFGIVDIYLK